MLPSNIFFGDIIYINSSHNTLAAFSVHNQPSFVSLNESIRTPFRNTHFQIFPASSDPISKLSKKYAKESVPVKAGSQVMFCHAETNLFLAVSTESDNSEASKRLVLAKAFTDSAVFKLSGPSNNSVKDDNILYDDLIQVQSEKFEQFVAIGNVYIEKNYLNAASSYTRTTNDFPRIMPRRIPNDFLGSHYAAVLSDSASDLKLGRYRSVQQIDTQQRVILNGDYVRIRYIDKWMTYYPNQDKKKDVYFENINDRFQSYNNIHSIFQVIDEQSISAEPITLGNTKQYVLKHFVTGNYIHFDSPTSLKAQTEISQSDNASPYCHFESENTDSLITEKLPLRIKFPTKQEYDAYIRPTEPIPVKNVQFEINTLYFFGFKVPEEYSYKNQKNLTRVLAEVSNVFEIEEYNVVLEKVSPTEMSEVIEMEQFANELQMLVDLLSITSITSAQAVVQEVNKRISDLLLSSRGLLDMMSRSGKLIDEEEKENSQTKKYQLEIADKHIQALIREFRIFDLIHMINFLLIKKVPKNLEGDAGSEKFDTEKYLELYELFSKMILNSLYENTSNRFYNSQYIRIYIHFMSDSCEGVFKKDENEQLGHTMRYITLGLLKMLLWDDDLDGLGQLNFYQSMIFNAMKSTKNYETYYLELLEHISSSKAYNLINSFRDAFTTTVLTAPESFKAIFPLISLNDDKELIITFQREGSLQIPLVQLKSHEEAYNYFIVAFRVIVALSTSKFMTFYHEFIKHFPLDILQAVLKHPEIALEVKMLVHLVILYVYFDYMKLPFSFIPPLIQTSNDQLRQALNQEEKKIVDFCKTCIGSFEEGLLKVANIYDEVNSNINNLNTQDCSQQINFLELFLNLEPTFQSVQVAVFYIQSAIQNGNLTIHFLNKAKEVLIFIRKMYQTSEGKELQIIPDLMELFTLVNQKMKTHSIIAIYNQVIKTQNPNAEVYSGKIIAGLKKIHLDSFAPIDMIALNEPVISGVALRYLTDVAKYENSIADELDKFVILSSMKHVEILKETIDIALTLNQHTRQYYFQKEREGQITLQGEEYVKNIELLEKLLTFIYNPAEHFLYSDEDILNEALIQDIQNPRGRFFRILRKEKVIHRDQPFLIRTEAISKLQQRIFSLLSIQEILLRLLNCTISLTVQNKPADSPAEVYQTRLILVILIAFVYNNRSNQDLLAKSHGFISLYYQQKYIDKSCDTLTLFAEVMRENEELLEVNKKFIYDITCYTFLGTIKPRAINKDSGAYLCTAIMSLHYLHKADIPLITFDTFAVAEGKLDDLLKNDFPSLNLLTKIQEKAGQPIIEIDSPACYYNIREMLESLCEIVRVCNKEGKKDAIHRLREKFNIQRFIKGLMKPDYRFQFELKNYLLKGIAKMNFWKHDVNTNLLSSDNKAATTNLFSYLINELLEFLNFSPKNANKAASQSLYEKFSQEIEVLESNVEDEESTNVSLKEVQKSYEDFKGLNLSEVKQTIFMDELQIPVVWEYLYIFNECWKFATKLCLTYPDAIQATKLFEYFLSVSEQLVGLADLINFKVFRKLRKYFTRMEDLAQYEQFRDKIKEVKELIVGKHEVLAQEKDLKDSKKQDKNIEDPTEKVILKTIIEHMRANKQKTLEANLEMFSQILSSHSARRPILSELLSVIEYNPANLSKETTSFVASFLKLYLQKTLPEDPNECSDNHYAAFYKVQQEFSEMKAEKRLVNGISVVRSAKNMKEIFKLILTYASGGNFKVIEKLKKSLSNIKDKLLWSNQKAKNYEETVTFILEQILEMIAGLNDNELTKFLAYCIRSQKEFIAPEADESKAILKLPSDRKSDILKKKMQSFFQEYANKDKDDVYKELGPLPVTIDTLLDVFRVSPDDTASLKIAKHTINKSIKEGDLKNALSDYFQIRINLNKDNLEFIKIDGTLILDLLISTVKYGMLVSE